jgi:glutamyl-Q tRNA(Asp) synthetase
MAGRRAFRFAPSPNGALHLGHALSALTSFDMAAAMGGRFLVRIEDIDTVRCRPHLIEAALADLAWLGLDWERPVLRQSEHFDAYAAAARRLEAMGLLYPCFASRTEIAAASSPGAVDPDGAPIYPGLWRATAPEAVERNKARGEPFALRLDMGRALDAARSMSATPLTFTTFDTDGSYHVRSVQPERWGDAVIVRKDTPSSYHLAVVVDDARQGITHVTRGLDLLAATDLHRLLQVLLGLPEPLYHHHRLIMDETGRKLAKSAGDTALAELRARGWTPARIRGHLGLPPAQSSG